MAYDMLKEVMNKNEIDHENDTKEFRLTKTRSDIWNEIMLKVRPVIKYRFSSASKAIDVSGELGARYIDRMIDVYTGRYQEIEEEIEALEQEKKQLEEKWETEEVKFRHLDKILNK
jgi:hypothetical protein